MGVEVPRRAKYLRVAWSELHRIHSHLLWIGLFADAFGFESLFMQCWRIRERIMDINEATTGNRVVVSVNVVGGVSFVTASTTPPTTTTVLSTGFNSNGTTTWEFCSSVMPSDRVQRCRLPARRSRR